MAPITPLVQIDPTQTALALMSAGLLPAVTQQSMLCGNGFAG